ncbi:MAG: RES family NAD+ phosphorylase [Synechococcaceae cyanobacterium]|jgi:RES domain-containing protein
MRVWKICRKPYVDHALDGIAGMYTTGRWHTKGNPIVYTASSAALAALEVLVHVDPLMAPSDLRLLAIEIQDDLSTAVLEPTMLQGDWFIVPAPASLQTLGVSWLTSGGSAVLSVPSAVITVERNFLLNPRHPEAQRIRIISDEAFTFDTRLL